MQVLGNTRREGFGRKETSRAGLVFCLSVSFLMVLFSLYGAQASVFEKARESVLDTFEPVLSVVGAPVRWTERRVGDVQDYFRLKSENERLREENDELRTWMNEAISLRAQIAYYETILDTKLPEPAAYVDARVIGENGGPYQHALILSAGGRDGVRKGSAVIDDDGLIGRIVTTGGGASRVLLLTDYESRVPVFIEGAGAEALLAGRSTRRPVLQFFAEPPEDPIRTGARVVTSGAGGLLPRGIPVGTVTVGSNGTLGVNLLGDVRAPDLVRVVDYEFPTVASEIAEEPSSDGGDLGEVASLGG